MRIALKNSIPNLPAIAFAAAIVVAFLSQLLSGGLLAAQQKSDLSKTDRLNTDLPNGSVVKAASEKMRQVVVRLDTIGGSEQVAGKPFRSQASTGTVVNSQGMVLTAAYNLAHEPTAIFATYSDGTRLPMSAVAGNTARNVVLLKPTGDASSITKRFRDAEFSFAPRSQLQVGQAVIAVGTSENSNLQTKQVPLNLSVGIISATNRIWGKAIQTDANVSATNYGGPLLDIRGRLIGLLLPASPDATTVADGVDWYDSGVGFAVPFNELRLQQLADGEEQAVGSLGISFATNRGFASPSIIKEVEKDSAAATAGLKKDDVVTKINGINVRLATQAKHQLGPLYAGDEVTIELQRDTKSLTIKVKLGR